MMQEDERMGRRGRERRVYAIGLTVAACAYRLVSTVSGKNTRDSSAGFDGGVPAGCLRGACRISAGGLREAALGFPSKCI